MHAVRHDIPAAPKARRMTTAILGNSPSRRALERPLAKDIHRERIEQYLRNGRHLPASMRTTVEIGAQCAVSRRAALKCLDALAAENRAVKTYERIDGATHAVWAVGPEAA